MQSPLDRKFAEFLRSERGNRSFAEFSRVSGLPQSTLYRLEKGEQSITLGRLDGLLKRLKKTPADVFGHT